VEAKLLALHSIQLKLELQTLAQSPPLTFACLLEALSLRAPKQWPNGDGICSFIHN